jgi:hypothetical protein
MRKVLAILGILAVLAAGPFGRAAAEAAKLYPVDISRTNEEIRRFKDRLLLAVKNRDVNFIVSILSPEVLNSYGPGANGIENFKAIWKLQTPSKSALWELLSQVLELGIAGDEDYFCAPYTAVLWPDGYNPFEFVVITGADVRAHEKPAVSSRTIDTLSYDIVQLAREGPKIAHSNNFVRISTPSGKKGYVSMRYVRSPVQYRFCFSKVADGQWQLVHAVEGD